MVAVRPVGRMRVAVVGGKQAVAPLQVEEVINCLTVPAGSERPFSLNGSPEEKVRVWPATEVT